MDKVYPGSVNDYLTFSSLRSEHIQDSPTGYKLSEDGILTVPYHNGDAMLFLAYIEFGAGWVRGNHYHQHKVENLCVVKGTVKARYYLAGQPDNVLETWLSEGDTVTILPGCVHSYEADDFAVALEYSPQIYDGSDVVRPALAT